MAIKTKQSPNSARFARWFTKRRKPQKREFGYNTNQRGQFFSQEPLVGTLANDIESRYPGHVVAVNKEVTTPDGNVVTEFDIETQNAVIQVKSGG